MCRAWAWVCEIDTHNSGTSALHIQALTQHNPKALSAYQHSIISRDQADQAYVFFRD